MNLQDLRYFVAVAEHRHFGTAATACHVSQPTLSGQLRKLEEHLGVTLFERTNRRVALTAVGEMLLERARRVLEEASALEGSARSYGDQLAGTLRLGAIPTLAPFLIPAVYSRLRAEWPQLALELWEDLTATLVQLLCDHRLDAALLATEVEQHELSSVPLFTEPFLAVLPPSHRLAESTAVREADLAADILVLADGHCLADQTLRACGGKRSTQGGFRAAGLDTIVNLVAAGHGTTLVPALAAGAFAGRGVVLRPLEGSSARTIRLVSRATFSRPRVLRVLEKTIVRATSELLPCTCADEPGEPRSELHNLPPVTG